ncbi:hypothetical protein M758_UG306800 [Ceratodon purpureus]|nr:hypothetical protein M758_UG306800 [Ceratodon purpureus]
MFEISLCFLLSSQSSADSLETGPAGILVEEPVLLTFIHSTVPERSGPHRRIGLPVLCHCFLANSAQFTGSPFFSARTPRANASPIAFVRPIPRSYVNLLSSPLRTCILGLSSLPCDAYLPLHRKGRWRRLDWGKEKSIVVQLFVMVEPFGGCKVAAGDFCAGRSHCLCL